MASQHDVDSKGGALQSAALAPAQGSANGDCMQVESLIQGKGGVFSVAAPPIQSPADSGRKRSIVEHALASTLTSVESGVEHALASTLTRAKKLKGDLASTAKWAFRGGEVDELALRLMRGHCVFSRDWKSDLWLHLKNKQIFLSIFLCYPKHPFSRTERRNALLVSCLLAWGLECCFCIYWTSCDEHPELNFFQFFFEVLLLKIAISAVTNGLYDAVLEFGMTCACVQTGVPATLRDCCNALSSVQLAVQASGGVFVIFYGISTLWAKERETFAHDISVSIRELVIGKCVGLFVVTMLVETLGFMFGRRRHMKPDRDEDERLKVWRAPSPARFPFSLCGKTYQGEPPAAMWDHFIGEDKHYIDLPERAPTYDVSATVLCWTLYRESASDPLSIPRWFLSDMTKPPTRIQKWLRSDLNPRILGREDLWDHPDEHLPEWHPNFKGVKKSQVAPVPPPPGDEEVAGMAKKQPPSRPKDAWG